MLLSGKRLLLTGVLTPQSLAFGIAELALGSETWQKLLTRADQAMYQAKALGRDQWSASPNK